MKLAHIFSMFDMGIREGGLMGNMCLLGPIRGSAAQFVFFILEQI